MLYPGQERGRHLVEPDDVCVKGAELAADGFITNTVVQHITKLFVVQHIERCQSQTVVRWWRWVPHR